ncbi:MAG: D-arabinose 5-phosphate isomerase [Zetaproteobacteria bacterium CG12_big_fil_rev_8_21_14_0_65_54_13]|nr:MAG: D-arabinose 5-phosphate isomerase [Zetaproteobacteria bacterium CG23_combo_of_CG06-09_8_20_14_all_54_7]PIW49950.1 MAG: D-arabinose 5-phosphate isomerase [Zetaproteobacteria bacterium CG12_big_fil_rev_8_21_14_0_65_54_13]PIX54239.1 MAG: D-arabinose 5-phosphate isomerase [Zetaproteobacteria bacterium CG_4_10_14_3_um_filter_54_28]PJA28382.1 MAG: D-arabinose 5-phosphate isomerase [Zetaproteobacteria bacterium CG_4_9_14_3_um_filter_54_145]
MKENSDTKHQAWLDKARKVLDIEIAALHAQRESLDDSFIQAIETILGLKGRLVVVGMGKSGIIAKKIAATFASTGTPAFFVHAAEAQHGDLGMITGQDAVLALSHSGETAEVCGLLPEIRRRGAHVIAMTGDRASTLARYADTVLHIDVQQEACPLNLAPTASTTATLALGDALAVVVLKERGFREEDFARVHPAGSLGRKLLRVQDIMHQGADLPMVARDASLREAIMEISAHRLGITGITEAGQVIGCITDGDLRRILESGHMDLEAPVHTLMHPDPMSIEAGRLASEALRVMEENKVLVLFARDEQGRINGIIHMHDILQGGIK